MKEKLNSLIMEAMKAHDSVKTEALRAVKTAFMNWETSKENVGKELNEAVEVNIIRKLVAQYKDTADMCNDGKHDELVKNALDTAKILEEYLPAPVTPETIEKLVDEIMDEKGLEKDKKNMGLLIKEVKARLAGADGKVVSMVVSSKLA